MLHLFHINTFRWDIQHSSVSNKCKRYMCMSLYYKGFIVKKNIETEKWIKTNIHWDKKRDLTNLQVCLCFFFFWLCSVFIVAHWLFLLRSTSSEARGLSSCKHMGLSWPAACGFPDRGSNPSPLHLQGGSLTTGSPGKCLIYSFWFKKWNTSIFKQMDLFNGWHWMCGNRFGDGGWEQRNSQGFLLFVHAPEWAFACLFTNRSSLCHSCVLRKETLQKAPGTIWCQICYA